MLCTVGAFSVRKRFLEIHTPVNLTGILPQITMAVLESRSKRYDSEDWFYIWKHIIHHLRQEELMAFAPKACIAQADPQPPQSPPVVPFPFMKLPLELRSIVYKIHFSQPGEPHHLVPPSRSHIHVVSTNFRMDVAPSGLSMGGSCASTMVTFKKDLYHEAMPLCFQTTQFRFNSFMSLGQFLNVIGPYQQQHLTSVILDDCRCDTSKLSENYLSENVIHAGLRAMKLLRSCAALRHLKITLPATVSHMAETSEYFEQYS